MTEQREFALRAEAACCIWEYLVEIRLDTITPDAVTRAGVHRAFKSGTATMRHWAITASTLCLDVFDAMGGHEAMERLDLIPYDWEFVPAFVVALDWSDGCPAATGDAKAIAARLVATREATLAARAVRT